MNEDGLIDDFEFGVFYSAALLVNMDDPTLAADILEQAGYLNYDVTRLDSNEKEAMLILEKQDSRCNFIGLIEEDDFCADY